MNFVQYLVTDLAAMIAQWQVQKVPDGRQLILDREMASPFEYLSQFRKAPRPVRLINRLQSWIQLFLKLVLQINKLLRYWILGFKPVNSKARLLKFDDLVHLRWRCLRLLSRLRWFI